MTDDNQMLTIDDVVEWRTLGRVGAERGERLLDKRVVFDTELAQQFSEFLRREMGDKLNEKKKFQCAPSSTGSVGSPPD